MRFTRLTGTSVLAILVLAGCGAGNGTARIEKPGPPPSTTVVPSETTIDPCVVGEWLTSEWALPGPVGEPTAKGGADAHLEIRGNGLTEWDFDLMDPMVMFDPDINLTDDNSLARDGDGTRVSAGEGRWTVAETDLTGLTGSTSSSIGGSSPSSGFGSFVGILDGSYTCSGDLLSYSTQNPADGKTVNVLLHRL